MKEYNVEITLEDGVIIRKKVEAEDEINAMDKIYEHYKNNKIRVYDIKIVD